MRKWQMFQTEKFKTTAVNLNLQKFEQKLFQCLFMRMLSTYLSWTLDVGMGPEAFNHQWESDAVTFELQKLRSCANGYIFVLLRDI